MRELLRREHHAYADGHKFGNGPNWRIRAIRQALKLTGTDENLLRHNVTREVFCCKLAANFREVLNGTDNEAKYVDSWTVSDVSALAKERWVLPRAGRHPEFASWRRENLYPNLTEEGKQETESVAS
jgi:hypothetical protein